MKRILIITCALVGMATAANAQATASATASATIITPIMITKTVDLDFGNVAVSGTAGTVLMSPAGVRTPNGGVTLPAVAGTPAAASFTVTGEASYTYAITLPTAPLTITSGANTMTVDLFTSTPSGTGTLSAGAPGTQTVDVGATLNVNASQAAGLYISATPFDVTVNYN
jgi:hypothetical protein